MIEVVVPSLRLTMAYSDYTEQLILFYSQNYRPPAIHKSIECCTFLTHALMTAQHRLR